MSLVYRPDDPRANANGMVDVSIAEPRVRQFGNAPYVISDHMEPTRHMATGEYFTSKRAFRQRTKDLGYVEIGNDVNLKPRAPIKLDRAKRVHDIKQAIAQLRKPKRRRRATANT